MLTACQFGCFGCARHRDGQRDKQRDGAIVGVYVLQARAPAILELMNIAVKPEQFSLLIRAKGQVGPGATRLGLGL